MCSSAVRAGVEQEVELADGVVAVGAHLQAVGHQPSLLLVIKGHQLFGVQAEAGVDARAERGVERRRVVVEIAPASARLQA